MFSRTAKSAVKSLGSRRIRTGEKNFKLTQFVAEEIDQTLPQLLKKNAKLNVLALHDVVAIVNRPLPNYNFYDGQLFKPIPGTLEKKSCSNEDSHSDIVFSPRQIDNNNHQDNNRRNQIKKLVEAFYRLPIAEGFNSSLIPIEELMLKLQAKEENLATKFRESGISERRERSSSSMKSAIEIAERSIESNQIETDEGSLWINLRQQLGITFVKNFQQDTNSAVDYKDRSSFSFLREHFVTDFRHCSDREFEESKMSYDRQGNDDYFPQGEEYEQEIGIDDHQSNKKTPSQKPPRLEDEHDNFEALMFKNNKGINGGPSTGFMTHVYFSSIEELIDVDRTMLTSKKVSNKDAIEKLQTLIEKVTEFKRRVFRFKHDLTPKTGATMDGRKEKKITNENNDSTNRSCSINQRLSTSAY